jgi:hypothetical protein
MEVNGVVAVVLRVDEKRWVRYKKLNAIQRSSGSRLTLCCKAMAENGPG